MVKKHNVMRTDPKSTDLLLLGSATRHSPRILDHEKTFQHAPWLPALAEGCLFGSHILIVGV